ncbi:SGNH hydrolase [Anaeromyces robustus]|uniref:SGNH hydrolase n=1 Tax=Anaeromyces robustus TaxID=1754192 RepID=A0A1Y1XEX6_9FUNG|nr:SGNH hydrolase [Anaeromyces robustus]|eukprot:ORX83924.1 SGNH hydrolase [Anaeromyces robustus]
MEFKGIFIFALTIVGFVNAACNAAYGQCGGQNFYGETCCVSGYYCNKVNEWYSQCIPGSNNNNNNNNNNPGNTSNATAGNKPNTIFIAGDSTADSNGANNRKTNGWGKFLGDYVTSTVNNQAKSGQSARSYWRDGRWNSLIQGVSKGDYVFIQFGHNDVGGPHASTERGSAGGEGDETVTVTLSNGQQEVVHTFPWYIRQMAKQVQAKGATPLLLSLTPNFSFVDGKIPEGSRFQGFMKLVSDEMKIPYIDLYSYIARQYERLGENYLKTNNWFPSDYKHTSPAAADFNAQLIINAIKCQKINDLIAALNDKGRNVNYACTV